MKLIIKFTSDCTVSLNFEIYFLEFPWEIDFGCKKDGNILKVILVQGFCPLKTEIARFLFRFRLNFWHTMSFVPLPHFSSYKGGKAKQAFFFTSPKYL